MIAIQTTEEGASSQTEDPFSIIDGAAATVHDISAEIEPDRRIAADTTLSIERRLDAFESIFDSEVGDTGLTRARNLERAVSLRQLYLKFEGGNPTGTQKDRIAGVQVMDALRRGYDTVTLATCGNYGVAMAFAASLAGLRCLIYVPGSYHTNRVREIQEHGAELVRVEGDYETAVEISRCAAAARDLYDANPGGANTAIQVRAYGQIAHEIYDELHDAPSAVAVPVSNGTTLAGVYWGFVSLYRRGRTSRIPRIVAGSSFSKNPIVQAVLKNLHACVDLRPEAIRESAVNEPLINWHASDGEHALAAVRRTGGWAGNATDRTMTAYSRLLREREGLSVLPASTAGLAALLARHRTAGLPKDRYVVLLTGRKI
jgi:threonine synthase